MQNITDIASLSSKEAKDIAEGVTYKFMSPEQYMSQTNNLALQTMMALVNSGFCSTTCKSANCRASPSEHSCHR